MYIHLLGVEDCFQSIGILTLTRSSKEIVSGDVDFRDAASSLCGRCRGFLGRSAFATNGFSVETDPTCVA